MKLGFAIPPVGSAVSSAAGVSDNDCANPPYGFGNHRPAVGFRRT
jgi:hypothetical protein